MKLAAGIVTCGLAALTAASAALYELNSPAASGPPLDVSAEQARLGLALALGVSRYHKLEAQGSNDKRIEMLQQFGRMENRMGMSPDEGGRFLLSLAGVGMEDADGLPLRKPVMVMKDAPGTRAMAELIKTLAGEKANTISQPLQEIASLDSSFCLATPSIRDAESLVSNYKFANYKSWQVGEENKGVTKEMTAVFNPDRNEDRHFMSEYLLFKAFVEKVVPRMHEDKSFAFCHFQGLQELIAVYGPDSTEANLALSLFHNALSRLALPSNTKTTLMLIPAGPDSSVGFEVASHVHQKRAEKPLSISATVPKPSVEATTPVEISPAVAPNAAFQKNQRCYKTQDACTNSTNSCFSHGECAKAYEACWSCVCKPTIRKSPDGGHKQVTHWAGYGCQKQDVSIPFNLFFVFTLAIALVVAWAIGLLYSVGEAELPGVLSAGVAPAHKRA